MRLVERLLKKGELYYITQNLMAYNTGKLEGVELDKEDPGNSEIGAAIFALFDYMLETADEKLSEKLIKNYHKILVADGGKYREIETIKNKVRGCISPDEIPYEMKLLVSRGGNETAELADFHYRFMKIDPFEKYSGIVGRMILFKECLRTDKLPILITSGSKVSAYSLALAGYEENPSRFVKMLCKTQEKYSEIIKSCPIGE